MNSQEKMNEYYKNIVANNSNCKNCVFNHNGICFFAIECTSHDFNLTNQFQYLKQDKERKIDDYV